MSLLPSYLFQSSRHDIRSHYIGYYFILATLARWSTEQMHRFWLFPCVFAVRWTPRVLQLGKGCIFTVCHCHKAVPFWIVQHTSLYVVQLAAPRRGSLMTPPATEGGIHSIKQMYWRRHTLLEVRIQSLTATANSKSLSLLIHCWTRFLVIREQGNLLSGRNTSVKLEVWGSF